VYIAPIEINVSQGVSVDERYGTIPIDTVFEHPRHRLSRHRHINMSPRQNSTRAPVALFSLLRAPLRDDHWRPIVLQLAASHSMKATSKIYCASGLPY
jgi:hypothetical protein